MQSFFSRLFSNVRAFFSAKSKQKAIRTYAVKLSYVLKSRYGNREQYMPQQVCSMIREWGYDGNFQSYALAMYCNLIDFDDYHQSIGKPCDYDAMRTEVTQCLNNSHESFPNNNSFGTSDLLQFSDDFQSSYGNNLDGNVTCIDSSSGYDGGSSYDGGGSSCDSGNY